MAERTDVAIRARAEGDLDQRSAEEIRQDIAAKRETISETVDKLGDRIQQSLDWREYVNDYPFVALGAAAGLGLLVSGLLKPRPTPRDRIMDALAESVEDVTDRFRSNIDSVVSKRNNLSTSVKAAVSAMITRAAINYAKQKLGGRSPGQEEARSGGRYRDEPTLRSSDISNTQAYGSSNISS
jgi:ElaB/YqjD/DUF883 family membrane-anchored ribosome-binding protein